MSRLYQRLISGRALTLAVILAATIAIGAQLSLRLVWNNVTPSFADYSSHSWLVWYSARHLLNHLQLVGWTKDASAGMPIGYFYFPLPVILVNLVALVVPRAIALKLVIAAGPLLYPLAAWRLGRGLDVKAPGPALMAASTVGFAIYPTFMVLGGSIVSTYAGEYSYALGIVFGMLFLGQFAKLIRTGRGGAITAVLGAATLWSHSIVAVFAAIGALVVLFFYGRYQWRKALGVACIAGALSAAWFLPQLLVQSASFGDHHGILFSDRFQWHVLVQTWPAFVLSGLVFAWGIRTKQRAILALAGTALITWLLSTPLRVHGIPLFRLIPLVQLCTFLLVGIGLAELVRAIGGSVKRYIRVGTLAAGLVAAGVLLVMPLTAARIPGVYARLTNTGIEQRPGWPALSNLALKLEQMPGGRVAIEEDGRSALALGVSDYQMLSIITNEHDAVLDTNFAEASRTTPYIDAAMGRVSSNPQLLVAGEQAAGFGQFERGIDQLRELGATIYVAGSAEAIGHASHSPQLSYVGRAGTKQLGWNIYTIHNSGLAVALTTNPTPVTTHQYDTAAAQWFGGKGPLVSVGGPTTWRQATSYPAAQITNIREGQGSVSFDTSRIGVPVLVRESWFPHWHVTGGTMVRAGANMMVVIPTSQHVTLTYQPGVSVLLGDFISILGLAAAIGWAWRSRRTTAKTTSVSVPELVDAHV